MEVTGRTRTRHIPAKGSASETATTRSSAPDPDIGGNSPR